MKKLQPNKLDNIQYLVETTMKRHNGENGFPKMEDYHVTKKSLDDYLFDYQSFLDSKGSQQSQLTVYGTIAFLPVLVFSAFDEQDLPWGRWSLIVVILLGVLLALFIWSIVRMIRQMKLRQIRASYPQEAEFVDVIRDFFVKNDMSN